MEAYADYTVEIRMISPFITAFQSDTIFGHICWAVRFLDWSGTDKLREFLDLYDRSDSPPLLISNGFPKGYLPKPAVPPVTQAEIEEVVGKDNRIRDSFRIKTIKNLEIIPKESFSRLQKDRLTSLQLFREMHEELFKETQGCSDSIYHEMDKIQPMIVQHNTINRMLGRPTRGLYAQEEFFAINQFPFEIYLKTNYFSRSDFQRIFGFIKEQGFGRDKATGKGHFDFEIKDGADLPESGSPNAFVTLSSYVPTESDPVDGYYNVLLKYGKLGGSYAKGTLNRNPFKKPLIMFSAGSTFHDSGYHTGKHYGSLIKDIHHDTGIRHYAFAFPLGVTL
jgi:CRISPR-associated protein Csm4